MAPILAPQAAGLRGEYPLYLQTVVIDKPWLVGLSMKSITPILSNSRPKQGLEKSAFLKGKFTACGEDSSGVLDYVTICRYLTYDE